MNTFYMLALSGCISEGNTMEEAERNIIEAIEFTLNLMKKRLKLPTGGTQAGGEINS